MSYRGVLISENERGFGAYLPCSREYIESAKLEEIITAIYWDLKTQYYEEQ